MTVKTKKRREHCLCTGGSFCSKQTLRNVFLGPKTRRNNITLDWEISNQRFCRRPEGLSPSAMIINAAAALIVRELRVKSNTASWIYNGGKGACTKSQEERRNFCTKNSNHTRVCKCVLSLYTVLLELRPKQTTLGSAEFPNQLTRMCWDWRKTKWTKRCQDKGQASNCYEVKHTSPL